MPINTAPEKSEKSERIRKLRIATGVLFFALSPVCDILYAQDFSRWMEQRYSFEISEHPVSNYGELTSIVRDAVTLARSIRNEHLATFLRKHSVRHVHAIALFKSVYQEIHDSTLALAALLTGLNETYLDKAELAGAGRLSVLQALRCGLRIDPLVDERFNFIENLRCLQFWMRKSSFSPVEFLKEFPGDNNAGYRDALHQVYILMLRYFSAIPTSDKPFYSAVVPLQHGIPISKSQWIILRADLRKVEALNPAIRTQVIPADYTVLIPKDVTEFNVPVAFQKNYNQPEIRSQTPSSQTRYLVKRGDTLIQIAKKFGITVKELMSANQLKNDRIVEGQTLVIPSK